LTEKNYQPKNIGISVLEDKQGLLSLVLHDEVH